MRSELSIRLLQGGAHAESPLVEEWDSFALGCEHSFFLSGFWIRNWLALLPPETDAELMLICRAEDPVAMAWIVGRKVVRHGIVRSRTLFLNEPGRQDLDQLTIEHNGLLSRAEESEAAIQKLLEWFGRRDRSWDELVISGIEVPSFRTLIKHADNYGLNVRVTNRLPSPYVDLEKARASELGYLGLISRNSRSQIRRSLRLYEQEGPIRLSVAGTLSDAEAYMARLVKLHQEYWNEKGENGAFADEKIRRFHRDLIKAGISKGCVQIVRVAAGRQVIGYLYNFLHNGIAYNYQSGFIYSDDNRLKPGMVCHYLAIQHNLNRGSLKYDFLVGNERYKQSLATDAREQVWCLVQRPKLIFRVEDTFRMIKRRFEGRVACLDTSSNGSSTTSAET
jgi:hypothetical protein